MTRSDPEGRAPAEAAAWCARLNNRSVSTAELEAFYAWRREPVNAAAYAEAEHAWRATRSLGSDEDIGDAVAEILARPVAARPWWREWRFQLGLAVSLLVIGLIGAWMVTRPLVLETGVGEQRLVRLADGSRVRLDTQSRIEIRLRAARRDVLLARGQAFFEVAKDAARPFVVSADGSSVRALGTRFGVRADDGRVSVILDEGSVRVSGRESGTATLRPGQMVVVAGGRVGAPAPADTEAMTSWTSGRLVFRDTPLATAVAEMNRYNNAPILLDARRAGTMRVSGMFDTGNSDAFVAAASAVSGLRIDHPADGSVHLVE